MMGQLGDYMDRAAVWIGENQELVSTILTAAMVLGGFLTVAGTGIAVVGGLGLVFIKLAGFGKGFVGIIKGSVGLIKGIPDLILNIRIMALYAGDSIRFAFGVITRYGGMALGTVKSFGLGVFNMGRQAIIAGANALPGLIASVWGFTTALLANPVTWIVLGIIALIAVLILLWRNWDSVTAWIESKWTSFTATVSGTIDSIKALFSDWSWIKESGAKLILTFTEGIRGALSAPIEAVKGGLSKIREMLPFSDAKTGPLSELTLSGQRVLETMTTGINQTADDPAKAVQGALSRITLGVPGNVIPFPQVQNLQRAASPANVIALPSPSDWSADAPAENPVPRQPVSKISITEILREVRETTAIVKEKDTGTIIQQLIVNADIRDIDDLKKLFKLVREMEDIVNANGISTDQESA